MSNLVMIDGTEVDLESPCDVVNALKRIEIKLAIGGAVGAHEHPGRGRCSLPRRTCRGCRH